MTGKILRPKDKSGKDILAAKFELEKEDLFHFKNLYEWMHDYLDHEGWEDTDEVGGDKFEHYYWEKRFQNDAREQRIWWRVKKHPEGNPYLRYVMLINFRNLYAKKLEIVHKGQKVGTWKGDLTFLVEAWLQVDPEGAWSKNWLMKKIEKLYWGRIYRTQIEKHKKELWREAYKFNAWMKQYLDMKVPFEQPGEFHPVGGVGPNPEAKA